MSIFSDREDDYSDVDDGWLFRDGNEYPDGHPKSAYKDDGDMKLFKGEDD